MAVKTSAQGLDNVLKNLNKEIKKIEGDVAKGILASTIFIKGESIELTPKDLGPLRLSAFTDLVRSTGKIIGRIGYTIKYAAWVHEMPMTLKGKPRAHFGRTANRSDVGPVQAVEFGGGSGKGTYWDLGENKFLEKAIKRNHKTILNIIKKRAKIKR